MILSASQAFTVTHPAGPAAALALVRDPAKALAQVRFLRKLKADTDGVGGELVVPVPVMGEVDLPFYSTLRLTQDGAELIPVAQDKERAWVEVSGQARVCGDQMAFHFDFLGHLTLPEAEGWGAHAFEKMVRAAAERTLSRVAQALPAGIEAATKES